MIDGGRTGQRHPYGAWGAARVALGECDLPQEPNEVRKFGQFGTQPKNESVGPACGTPVSKNDGALGRMTAPVSSYRPSYHEMRLSDETAR